jgi:hypothetical protein
MESWWKAATDNVIESGKSESVLRNKLQNACKDLSKSEKRFPAQLYYGGFLSVEEEAAASAMLRQLDFEETTLRQLQSGWDELARVIIFPACPA